MTLQLYYQLQAKLQALETQHSSMGQGLEEAREIFNQIDPNQLAGAITSPLPGPINSLPQAPNAPVPVVAPKQRKKLSTPVLTGPLKDVVEDILTQKAEDEAAAAAPKRIAPYEVEVKNIGIGSGGEYFATVFDAKYNEEGMVQVPQGIYDEFQKDPNGIMIDLGPETLEKTEWLPAGATQSATEQVATTEA